MTPDPGVRLDTGAEDGAPIEGGSLAQILASGAVGSSQLRTLCGILQAARQPMFVLWGKRRQLFYNDACSGILGERHPGAFGRPILDAWAEIAGTLEPLVSRACAGESIVMDDIVFTMLRRGVLQDAHFSFSCTPIHGAEAGEVLGVFCVCAEIAHPVLQEESRIAAAPAHQTARDSHARRKEVLDSMGEGFVVLDQQYRVLEINAEGVRLDGRPEAEIVGRSHWALWPASVGTAIETNYRRAMAERVPVHFEHHYVSDAHDYCLAVRAYPVSGGIAAFYRDITAITRAEAELRDSHDRFRAAIEAVGVMWTNDADGQMRGEQPGWAALTGQTPAEYSGFGWASAVHPEDAQPTVDAWNQAVAEQRLFTFEHRVRRRDGAWRRFAIRAVPVVGQDGSLREWVGVHIDITDAALAAEALRAADRRKDEFLATLAHELRNPLAATRAAAELLGRPELPRDRIVWSAGVIARQSRVMSSLLDELLDLSRFRSGSVALRPESVELAPLVESAVETVSHLLDTKQHRLSLELPDARLVLQVDRLRTTQVLINLLTNAAKYTDPGGRLQVVATAVAGEVRIDVVDNGIGLAAESLVDVFGMFTQVRGASDRSGGGLGIGLTLAKRLVELQGGRIEVFSDGLGHGSRFRVFLPLAPAPTMPPLPPAPPR